MSVVVRRYTYRYPHNNYYFSLLHLYILAFFGSSIPTSLFILKMFFVLFMVFLCSIPNVAQRTFEIVQSRHHMNKAI